MERSVNHDRDQGRSHADDQRPEDANVVVRDVHEIPVNTALVEVSKTGPVRLTAYFGDPLDAGSMDAGPHEIRSGLITR